MTLAAWATSAAVYAAFLAIVALIGVRRPVAMLASIGFGGAAMAAATVQTAWAQLLFPAAAALGGYWLSGLFAGPPQPGLEERLLDSDGVLFDYFRIDRRLESAPMWVLESLELAYSAVYVVVVAGAVAAAFAGTVALRRYWVIVLSAEFVCYAALPFVRSRPPRSLEPAGVIARRAPVMRRFNEALVGRASIQVNTIPSGHVAGAVAAGLAVASWSPLLGGLLLACAASIAMAATLGRYHYAIDCVLGACVAVAVWLLA